MILSALQSCSDTNEVEALLHKADMYMEEQPELALEKLESIDKSALASRKLQARYALLYSMALDKNYIDLTTDSIIAPAVTYYKNHGSPDERMKTQYYLGRVRANAADHDNAMIAYVRAERYVPKCKDNLAIGRLYRARMQVHKFLFDREGQLETSKLASHYYLAAGDTSRYLLAISDIASACLQMDLPEQSGECLAIMKSRWELLTEKQRSIYYALYINQQSFDVQIIDEYLKNVSEPYVHWLTIAAAYNADGQVNAAADALEKYCRYARNLSPSYFYCLAEVKFNTGNYRDASVAYKEYLKQTDSTDLVIFNSEARFMEERYKTQIASIRRRNVVVVLSLSLIISLLLGAQLFIFLKSLIRKRKEECERFDIERANLHSQIDEYERMYKLAVSEKERLSNTVIRSKIDKNLRRVIEERLAVLNGFIAANVSASFRVKANEQLKHFMQDQSSFMKSTAESFNLTHPGFISFLYKSGLDQWEVGCCCLYCIGLNGVEIATYLDKSLYYKRSSAIRKKLGLSRSINLDRFLKEKLKEFSC